MIPRSYLYFGLSKRETPKSSGVPRELHEIDEMIPAGPTTPQELWDFYETNSEAVKNLPDVGKMKIFRVAVETGLKDLPITAFESSADSDPSYGQTAREIKALFW